MKIAAVANEAMKREISSRPLPSGVEWIWVDSAGALGQQNDASLYIDLDFIRDPVRIEQLSQLLPRPVIINSVVHTLREIGQPFMRINGWTGCLERPIAELAAINIEAAGEAGRLFKSLNWEHRIVPDIPGMISPRIIAMIVNEAYYTLQEKVSTKAEIDTAMKLGTNYPFGPFEWSQRIGLQHIEDLLTVLSQTDSRYEVAELLKKERKQLAKD